MFCDRVLLGALILTLQCLQQWWYQFYNNSTGKELRDIKKIVELTVTISHC